MFESYNSLCLKINIYESIPDGVALLDGRGCAAAPADDVARGVSLTEGESSGDHVRPQGEDHGIAELLYGGQLLNGGLSRPGYFYLDTLLALKGSIGKCNRNCRRKR